jgi:hypothetical protein
VNQNERVKRERVNHERVNRRRVERLRRSERPPARLRAVALGMLAISGCFAGSRTTGPTGAEPRAFGAALAHIAVVNHTPYRLTIAFRAAAGPTREVAIGSIDAGARRSLAPVPAGEALILIARAAGVGELVLDPRSFTLDQRWVWEIPADAQFRSATAPPPDSRPRSRAAR